MKGVAVLIFLLVLTALVVLVIHGYFVGVAAQSHPTYIYFEEEEAATPTYYDATSNYSGGTYPYGCYYPGCYTPNTATPTPTPTIAVSGGGNVKN